MSNIINNKDLKTSILAKNVSNTHDFEVAVVLPDIRSAHNVGSIFRTADAAGVNRIYISGYSPTPLNKFHKSQPEIAKTALGAEKTIPWEYFKSHVVLLNKLKKEGFKIIAVEQTKKSISYKKLNFSDIVGGVKKRDEKEVGVGKIAFVFGNEVLGLPKTILNKADVCVDLPMNGMKESLNVSVTAGIILFQYLV